MTTTMSTQSSAAPASPFFRFSDKAEDLLASCWNDNSQKSIEELRGKIVALTDIHTRTGIYADDTLSELVNLYAWYRNENATAVLNGSEPKYRCRLVQSKEFVYRVPVRGKDVLHTGFRADCSLAEKTAFNIWFRTVWAVEEMNKVETTMRTRGLEDLRNQWNSVVNPTEFKKGSKWKVVGGRKYAKGKIGEVFWAGATRFGPSVGVAWSNTRGPDGKFTDVGFLSPHNLQYVLNDEDKKRLETLKQEAAQVDGVVKARATKVYEQLKDVNPSNGEVSPHPVVEITNGGLLASVRLG
jgi:hypothetical protein